MHKSRGLRSSAPSGMWWEAKTSHQAQRRTPRSSRLVSKATKIAACGSHRLFKSLLPIHSADSGGYMFAKEGGGWASSRNSAAIRRASWSEIPLRRCKRGRQGRNPKPLFQIY